AANRGTEPKQLTGLLRNELDWIVMKSLEKDRARRYETANGFAADVMRYLSGEPVLAVPPSVGYRLQKFARRHRGRVSAAGVTVLALTGAVAGGIYGVIEAGNRRAADLEAERAKRDRDAKAAEQQVADLLRQQAERDRDREARHKAEQARR